jgi:hypothetical protein
MGCCASIEEHEALRQRVNAMTEEHVQLMAQLTAQSRIIEELRGAIATRDVCSEPFEELRRGEATRHAAHADLLEHVRGNDEARLGAHAEVLEQLRLAEAQRVVAFGELTRCIQQNMADQNMRLDTTMQTIDAKLVELIPLVTLCDEILTRSDAKLTEWTAPDGPMSTTLHTIDQTLHASARHYGQCLDDCRTFDDYNRLLSETRQQHVQVVLELNAVRQHIMAHDGAFERLVLWAAEGPHRELQRRRQAEEAEREAERRRLEAEVEQRRTDAQLREAVSASAAVEKLQKMKLNLKALTATPAGSAIPLSPSSSSTLASPMASPKASPASQLMARLDLNRAALKNRSPSVTSQEETNGVPTTPTVAVPSSSPTPTSAREGTHTFDAYTCTSTLFIHTHGAPALVLIAFWEMCFSPLHADTALFIQRLKSRIPVVPATSPDGATPAGAAPPITPPLSPKTTRDTVALLAKLRALGPMPAKSP